MLPHVEVTTCRFWNWQQSKTNPDPAESIGDISILRRWLNKIMLVPQRALDNYLIPWHISRALSGQVWEPNEWHSVHLKVWLLLASFKQNISVLLLFPEVPLEKFFFNQSFKDFFFLIENTTKFYYSQITKFPENGKSPMTQAQMFFCLIHAWNRFLYYSLSIGKVL